MSLELRRSVSQAGEFLHERVWFWCGPCNTHHGFVVKGGPNYQGPVWTWNGDLERPTFSPSLLCRHGNEKGPIVCHLFLREGQVQYLGDCTHELAGKTVPVEPPRF